MKMKLYMAKGTCCVDVPMGAVRAAEGIKRSEMKLHEMDKAVADATAKNWEDEYQRKLDENDDSIDGSSFALLGSFGISAVDLTDRIKVGRLQEGSMVDLHDRRAPDGQFINLMDLSERIAAGR